MACKRIKTKQETVFSQLKSLRRDLRGVSENVEILQKEKERVDAEMSRALKEQKRIENQIDKLEEEMKEPELTDHARVQFFNRCLGFDMDKVDELILTERTKQAIQVAGNSGKFPFTLDNAESLRKTLVRPDFEPKQNYACRMRKGFVVTVVED